MTFREVIRETWHLWHRFLFCQKNWHQWGKTTLMVDGQARRTCVHCHKMKIVDFENDEATWRYLTHQ